MSENRVSQQQIVHLFSASILLLVFLGWALLLKFLTMPLTLQRQALDEQLDKIKLLSQLPKKWDNQLVFNDISQLMTSIDKSWEPMVSKYGHLQIQQVSKTELQATVVKIDEHTLIQWLWGIQSQYAFQIVKLSIRPQVKPALIDVTVNLKLLSP